MSQLPEKFLERLAEFIPPEKLPSVLDAFTKERAVTFRANTVKASANDLTKELQALGFAIEQFSWYKDAFILKNKSKEELLDTKLYKEGFFYIQNVSSMLPPLMLDPKPGETILDMAASPGSKTTQLAALMQNTGTIIANDKSPKRIFKLVANLKEQGVTNTITSVMPGEFLWKKYPEYFDKVLLDAPCTMEGRFTTCDADSYKDWSPRKIKELANLQKWMLRSAISCTKVGGTILYSTCAMSPEENEEVIEYILGKCKDTILIEPISLEKIPRENGLTIFRKKNFSREIAKTIRLYPDSLFEGFYIAKLQKVSSSFLV